MEASANSHGSNLLDSKVKRRSSLSVESNRDLNAESQIAVGLTSHIKLPTLTQTVEGLQIHKAETEIENPQMRQDINI